MRKIFFNGKVYTGEMPLQDSFIVEDNKFIFAGNFNEAQNFIDENTEKQISELIKKYSEIQKADEISSTPVGYQYIIVLTIYVDGNMSTFKSHELADNLENDISKLENIYKTIVHVNPI